MGQRRVVRRLAKEVEFLRSLMRQRTDVVILADGGGRIIEWSAGAEKILGYSKQEALKHHLLDFLVLGNGGIQKSEIEERFVRGENAVTDVRGFMKKRDGSVVSLLLSVEAMRQGKKIAGIILVGKDLTREVQLEQELRRANDKLEAIARADHLTGLFNRRAFDERLREEAERARRFGRPVALIFIDIDKFKNFNSLYGHQTGDKVLQIISGFLQNNIRQTDFLARWGGEEFCVVLPETDKAGALALAEKIRQAVATVPIVAGKTNQQIQITVSLGVATFIPDGTAEGLLRKANQAMLQAKMHGGNRVWGMDQQTNKIPFIV